MALYSIKDLEQLSGIKAHTIRIWEQRYGLLQPERNTANVRSYDRSGLITLLQVALLNESGIKISKIAGLAQIEVSEQVAQLSIDTGSAAVPVTALVLAALQFDEGRLEQILEQLIKAEGFEQAMLQVIIPFLERFGSGNPESNLNAAYANFARNLIVRRLHTETGKLPLPSSDSSPRFLLFLPQFGPGEVTLLLMQYLLRARNIPALYLGAGSGFAELQEINAIFRADHLATVLPMVPEIETYNDLLARISAACPDKAVYVCGEGNQARTHLPLSRVRSIPDLSVFIREISGL